MAPVKKFSAGSVSCALWNNEAVVNGKTMPILASAVRRLNRLGGPAVIYLHPYELAAGEVDWFRRCGTAFSRRRRWMQALWRSRVEPRLSYLLKEFSFATMSESLRAWQCVSRPDFSADRLRPCERLMGCAVSGEHVHL